MVGLSMALFLMMGAPLYLWFHIERTMPGYDRREGARTFLFGMVVSILFLPFQSIFVSLFTLWIEGWRLYVKCLFLDLVLPLLYLAGTYLWLSRKQTLWAELPLSFFAFGAGGLVSIGFHRHLTFKGWEEGFLYLLLPLLWVQLLFAGAKVLEGWGSFQTKERLLNYGWGGGWVLLMAWFGYLYRSNLRLAAWILIVGGFLGWVWGVPIVLERIRVPEKVRALLSWR